ncbi:MAG: tyrosine-type recombinase/integrase, partial [Planctomycetota bacterium]
MLRCGGTGAPRWAASSPGPRSQPSAARSTTCRTGHPLGVALIRLLLLTGCRLAEIRTLDWRDVEPDRLRLRHAKRGPRDVLLSDAAREVFEALTAFGDAGPVFPDPTRLDHPMPAPRQLWTKLKARAELPPRLRLHDLRHTFASMSLMSGETLAV